MEVLIREVPHNYVDIPNSTWFMVSPELISRGQCFLLAPWLFMLSLYCYTCVQIRKLDFCFGDALAKGCDTIITAGSTRSNHARTTAAAARQLGLEAHLVLFSPTHIQVSSKVTLCAPGKGDPFGK